jgi:hypothetical protein
MGGALQSVFASTAFLRRFMESFTDSKITHRFHEPLILRLRLGVRWQAERSEGRHRFRSCAVIRIGFFGRFQSGVIPTGRDTRRPCSGSAVHGKEPPLQLAHRLLVIAVGITAILKGLNHSARRSEHWQWHCHRAAPGKRFIWIINLEWVESIFGSFNWPLLEQN